MDGQDPDQRVSGFTVVLAWLGYSQPAQITLDYALRSGRLKVGFGGLKS